MDQQQSKRGTEADSPHSEPTTQSTGGRRHAGRFYLAAMAMLVGVLAAFMWLSQPVLEGLSGPAEEAARASATPALTVLPTEAPTAVVTLSVVTGSADSVAEAAQPARSLRREVAALRPTRTPTPIVYLDSTEAVVGLGGARVWNLDGSPVGELPQGVLFSATQRSADDAWLFGQSEDGTEGWISIDNLIIFDADRLAPADVAIVPVTPTPAPAIAEKTGDAGGAQPSEPMALELPTVTPGVGKGADPGTSGRLPTARIALEDSRLNIRAGPDSSHRVIAKAFPEELYALRAISGDGRWVQVDLPNVDGGFGWAAVQYLETGADLLTLPVSDAVSSAPAFRPGDEAWPAEAVDEPPAQPSGPEGGLPPMRLGPPSMGGKSSPADGLGLGGTLVIQKEWGGDIYVYDLESGDLRLLTGGFDPSISPDGSEVTFTRDGGENGVYVINIDGSDERLIFGGREHLRSPKFSPDGEYIVFERGDEYILCKDVPSRCRLSVKSPDGDLPERERQPSLARVRADGSDYWDPMDLPYARVPDWNEGGIVYQSLGGLQIAQNEPNVDTELVYFDILKQYEMDPDWQPGAGVIAFQRREAGHWEIFAVNPDGSDLHALTEPPFLLAESFPNNVSPAWSPDGDHIVFLSNRTAEGEAGDWGVWVMDADGGNPRRLPIELPFVYTYVSEQMLDWGP
jgi:hypothetical protein